ncbi:MULTISPECIES: shikimate 5-dehydrogenase [unclassified Pseudomonas]|uniref:shikimate 5-dehydrogenase n=1 Tax=unclassified Pseudomonas TaxID=196821 RepID=UPI002AC97F4C|nr:MULTISPECIES: shikimate 5-dehydrogenase [unclassified Pseudomonas]MEB0048561.1 shikimate 5-dehydrogenase [Pseudomonas sp. Dout3]MEB0099424.1 shikimate 5-dehydrogenase [Pseudomonas sp. DC1.2]WPX61622.1 shikimate 5-dehydrogenase [Pseudomonas sp. DC1.2]
MQMNPNKDTQLCMSLSARPGNFGLRFHNHLYEQLGLNFYYKAFSSQDLAGAVGGIRALGIRGCGVSMPFKEASIALVDELDASAAAIQSLNTIVNTNGHLKAYNTDYIAIAQLLETHQVPQDSTFVMRGSGGMAKAVASALRDGGYSHGLIVARNERAGSALAESLGYEWQPELGDRRAQMLINVTPIGMTGGPQADQLAFDADAIAEAKTVFDVVAIPSETPLIVHARNEGKRVITGLEVIAIQALEQFVLYTGVRPTQEQFQAAVAFARG